MKSRQSNSGHAPWGVIARLYLVDYLVLLAMIAMLIWSEYQQPFERYIYPQDDSEYWRYSYPLRTRQQVPSWAVPLIATLGPLSVITIYAAFSRPSRLELHNTVLGVLSAVAAAALITNLVKLGVGRPRPNFVARCWPGGGPMRFGQDGRTLCETGAIDPAEGRKSFPSGHTSWSTSGLGYLSFWAAGKLRPFDGRGHVWRLPAATLPVAGAAWIGITRIQDYWHHWSDVAAGFALGLLCAYAFYRAHFPCPASPRAGEAFLTVLDAPAAAPRADSYVDFPNSAAADLV